MAMSLCVCACGKDLSFNPCVLIFIISLVVAKNPPCLLGEGDGPKVLYIHSVSYIKETRYSLDTVITNRINSKQ